MTTTNAHPDDEQIAAGLTYWGVTACARPGGGVLTAYGPMSRRDARRLLHQLADPAPCPDVLHTVTTADGRTINS